MKLVTPGLARMRWLDWIFLIACLTLFAFYMPLIISANSDLAEGRFALFMDERITFDGVKKILHPKDISQFLFSVGDGGDHRYGRILWYSIAIFSLIPESLFGDSGQIVAARFLQVFFIISSYCIFAFGILRSWYLRLVLLVITLTIPFSDYYMTMPKPEPLQLLYLSIFSYFFVKKNASFSWYWIFIGLAFGTKISTLPALLVFTVTALVARSKSDFFKACKNPVINASVAFLLGVAIAVPILFGPVLMCVVGYFAFDRLIKKVSLSRVSRMTIAGAMIVTVFFVSRKSLNLWISSTFLNTTHGADRAAINTLSWVNYFFDSWLVAPYAIGLGLFILIFGFIVLYGAQMFKSGCSSVDQRTTAFTVALAGIALNIAVMIGAKRLWGMYLYPGTFLMLAGIIVMVDRNLLSLLNKKNCRSFLSLNKYLGCCVSSSLLAVALIYWMPSSIDGLKASSLRTSTPEYILQHSSYTTVVDFLDNYEGAEDERLRVMLTPSLFPPQSNKKYEIVEFWGPYIKWEEKPDVIIFGTVNTPRGRSTPKDSPNYKAFLIEREGYAAHVAEKGKRCQKNPCFTRVLELPNGGEILVLSKEE